MTVEHNLTFCISFRAASMLKGETSGTVTKNHESGTQTWKDNESKMALSHSIKAAARL